MEKAKIPSEALEGLMKKAFLDETLSPELFWDALINAHVYLPLGRSAPADINDDAESVPKNVPLLLGQDENGTELVWLFTSKAAMTAYMEADYPSWELPSPLAFTKIKHLEHEVLLIGPENVTLSLHPELIDALAEGRVPEFDLKTGSEVETKTIPKDATVHVGPPAEKTEALEAVLKPYFENTPAILEGAFIQVADAFGSRLLLGVRLVEENRTILKALVEKIAKTAEGILPRGKTMDITFMNGSLKDAFAKWGKPFFRRETAS